MRRLIVALALFAFAPAQAKPLRPADLTSTAAVLSWVNDYHHHPAPKDVPAVMRTLSRLGGLEHPEASGVYVGFLAGVLAANPDNTEWLIAQCLRMPAQDRWLVVRAVAYSGLPQWRPMLRSVEARAERYDVLSEKIYRRQDGDARRLRGDALAQRL